MPAQQLDTLQQLVTKHVTDPALRDLVGSSDFSATTTERGLLRWEQGHLVAALDVLNAYQRDRRSRSTCRLGSLRLRRSKTFTADPRTRLIELLKRWLRSQAGSGNVEEEEVRGITGLCREILNYPSLFPARNPRSFIQTIAEVYDHIQLQLREVLEHDRSCADLAHRVLSLSRNLISDSLAFLLLGATVFSQTDSLPSTEVVALWSSLPEQGHPLPGRADAALQRVMREVWTTDCGSMLSAVLSHGSCIRLFNGVHGEEEHSQTTDVLAVEGVGGGAPFANQQEGGSSSSSAPRSMAAKFKEAADQLQQGPLKNSGLAGAFRAVGADSASASSVRQAYIDAATSLHDLTFLLAEVLSQFHRISEGMGDYGMIRMSPWLHPFLDALGEKVQILKANLEKVNEAVESAYILARARNGKVVKPAPTARMCSRAHSCIERALIGKGNHVKVLLQAIEELKNRSAPERLPTVTGSIGDACKSLQAVWLSDEFRLSVGSDTFARMPMLPDPAAVVPGQSGDVEPGHTAAKALADWDRSHSGATNNTDSETEIEIEFFDPKRNRQQAQQGQQASHHASHQASHQTPLAPTATATSRRGGLSPSPSMASARSAASSGGGGCAAEQSERSTAASAASREPSDQLNPDSLGGNGPLVAETWSCTPSRFNGRLKRRDRRFVAVHDGALHVYASGSRSRVEAVMDPSTASEGAVRSSSTLSFSAKKLPEGASWEDGVYVPAEYHLEFSALDVAEAFHRQLKGLAGRPV